MISVMSFVVCNNEADNSQSYVIDGSVLTVKAPGNVKYEAENVDISNYKISNDNYKTIVERADASGGKFLAASTGDLAQAGYFSFNINLLFNAEITMTVAYSQTEKQKDNDIDMLKSYSYLIDENKSIKLSQENKVLSARKNIKEWQKITYEAETLPIGMHSIRVSIAESTKNANPNIDYFEFAFARVKDNEVTGVSVPANDFHTAVQYAYIHDINNLKNADIYAKGVVELSRPNAIILDFSYLTKSSTYVVEYADNQSFENSVIVENVKTKQYGVFNLKSGQDLFWRAANANSELISARVNHLTVANDGPRNLFIDGVSNVRDIGGYESSLVDGARINQGLYYRGANLNSITDEGKAELLRLGIRAEIDMRDSYQCNGPYIDDITYYVASIPSGTESLRFEGFDDVYLRIFNLIAEADKSPIYLHCTAGADRTGIVSFMLLTVCGASYEDIVRDYLFTNFSVQGERRLESEFNDWWKKLDSFKKESKAENAKAWLMSKGVSESTVEHIREIFVEDYKSNLLENNSLT